MTSAERDQVLARYRTRALVFERVAVDRARRFGEPRSTPIPARVEVEPAIEAARPVAEAGAAGPAGELSSREVEVLACVARGLSNLEIGTRLHISEETVKTHVRRFIAKLDVRNRAHAVAAGYELGLIGSAPSPGRG